MFYEQTKFYKVIWGSKWEVSHSKWEMSNKHIPGSNYSWYSKIYHPSYRP